MSETNSFSTRLCLRSVVESAAEGEAPSEWMLLCLEQEAGGACLRGLKWADVSTAEQIYKRCWFICQHFPPGLCFLTHLFRSFCIIIPVRFCPLFHLNLNFSAFLSTIRHPFHLVCLWIGFEGLWGKIRTFTLARLSLCHRTAWFSFVDIWSHLPQGETRKGFVPTSSEGIGKTWQRWLREGPVGFSGMVHVG